MHEIPDSLRGFASPPAEFQHLLAAACDPNARAERLWSAYVLIAGKEAAAAPAGPAHRLARFRALSRAEFGALDPAEHEELLCLELAACLHTYLLDVLSVEEFQQYWTYTVACGIIGRCLAPLCGHDAAAAFAGGMVHDVGRLVLMARHPERYANLLAMARRSFGQGIAEDLRAYERNLFGMDRYSLGALLAEAWELPAELKPLLGEFDREWSSLHFHLVDLVRGSCQLAHCLGYGFLRGGEALNPRKVMTRFPQTAREALDAKPDLLEEAARAGLATSAAWLSARAR